MKLRLSLPRPVARALGRLYGVLHGTLRVEGLLPDGSRVTPATYPFGREVFALCERDAFALGGALGRARFTTLIAPGRDGDWATEAVEAFGCRVVRGATERGGAQALARLLRDLRRRRPPRPRRRRSARPLGHRQGGRRRLRGEDGKAAPTPRGGVPAAVVVGRSWSKIWIPLPFSRVVVVIGEALSVPAGLDRAGRERFAAELTLRLAEARRRALAEVAKREDAPGASEAAA